MNHRKEVYEQKKNLDLIRHTHLVEEIQRRDPTGAPELLGFYKKDKKAAEEEFSKDTKEKWFYILAAASRLAYIKRVLDVSLSHWWVDSI